MDKMKMEFNGYKETNLRKLEKLFPGCVTEYYDSTGKLIKTIDFDKLKTLLDVNSESVSESYGFEWVGKRNAIREANRPIRKTLRPVIGESINWDTTGNLYIKGDNLDVMKLLQEAYLGKVNLIYIDPPYNTGGDFVYPDSFMMGKEEYDAGTEYFDEEGNVNYRRKNNITEARYHSDWCSMIYSRLLIARNFLAEEGVIFISIDDNEIANLLKICDEVFGGSNFVANIIWQKKYSPQNDARWFSVSHDYIICIAKNKELWKPKGLPRTDEMNARYSNPDNDPRGPWKPGDILRKDEQSSGLYTIVTPSGRKCFPHSGTSWRYPEYRIKELIEDNRIWFGPNGDNVPSIKRFLAEVKQEVTPQTIWMFNEVGHNQLATQELRKIFGGRSYFDTPKPVSLIKQIIRIANIPCDGLVLDFFGGSSTTAQAVMEFNKEEGTDIKYILVQVPETVPDKGAAAEDGLADLCEVGLKRIELICESMKSENIDAGVRVFALDSSNMNDVYFSANDYTQDLLAQLEGNIKSGRSDLDLFFGCLLEWGIPLTEKCEIEEIDGNRIITYADGAIIGDFSDNINEEVIRIIAQRKPLRVVFRDESFKDSAAKINVKELFKMYSSETNIKVI